MRRLRELRKNKNLSLKRLGEILGVAESTVSLYESGKREPDNDTMNRICDYFGISLDYLAERTDDPSPPKKSYSPTELTPRDRYDIARDYERLIESLDKSETLMFDGDPLSDEAIESIKAAMKLGLEAAKIKNKEKYTPKKYRGK